MIQTFLWYLLELNQGHMDFQSIALPPELRYRGFFSKAAAKVLLFFELPKFFLHFFEKTCICGIFFVLLQTK